MGFCVLFSTMKNDNAEASPKGGCKSMLEEDSSISFPSSSSFSDSRLWGWLLWDQAFRRPSVHGSQSRDPAGSWHGRVIASDLSGGPSAEVGSSPVYNIVFKKRNCFSLPCLMSESSFLSGLHSVRLRTFSSGT